MIKKIVLVEDLYQDNAFYDKFASISIFSKQTVASGIR